MSGEDWEYTVVPNAELYFLVVIIIVEVVEEVDRAEKNHLNKERKKE